jgi:hypothetical protein
LRKEIGKGRVEEETPGRPRSKRKADSDSEEMESRATVFAHHKTDPRVETEPKKKKKKKKKKSLHHPS